MKKLGLILLAASVFVSCNNNEEIVNKKKESFGLKMELGMALWKNKIVTFDGDVKKADSAYKADKQKLIDDIYKNSEKKEVDEKQCGHIFFNKYCQSCKDSRN